MNIAKFLITPVLQNIDVCMTASENNNNKKDFLEKQPVSLHDKYGQLKAKDWQQLTVEPPLLACGKKTMQNNFTWYLKFHVDRPTVFNQVQ